jgi:ATP-dependent Zn protease
MVAEFTDEELAYHEAGHAVLHVLLGGRVNRICIVRDDPKRGVEVPAAGDPLVADAATVHNRIVVLLGGEAALHVWRPANPRRPDAKDRARAEVLAATLSSEPASVLETDWEVAVGMLRSDENWPLVERLAKRLATERVLEGEDVQRLIRGEAHG